MDKLIVGVIFIVAIVVIFRLVKRYRYRMKVEKVWREFEAMVNRRMHKMLEAANEERGPGNQNVDRGFSPAEDSAVFRIESVSFGELPKKLTKKNKKKAVKKAPKRKAKKTIDKKTK